MSLPVEDTAAIHDLYARQSHAIDSGDAPAWAETFTPDGTFVSPSYPAPVRGHGALVRFADDLSADSAAHGHAVQHWIGNLALSPAGPGEVTARAYLSLVAVVPGEPPRPLRTVWITDRLVRTGDGWRFERRDVSLTPPSRPDS